MLTRCANCGVLSDDFVPLEEVPGLNERLDPGDEVPAGECKACGALCYVVVKDPPARDADAFQAAHDHDAELEDEFDGS